MLLINTRTIIRPVTLLLTLSLFCVGQPQGPLDEMTLGLTQREQVLANHSVLQETWANEVGAKVFRSLLETSIVKSGRNLPYQLTLLADTEINAYSTANGGVYVTQGIIESVLGKELGLWGMVLGHEIGHSMSGHVYKAYQRDYDFQLQRANFRWQAQQGNRVAQWALLGLETAGAMAKLKVSRDEENEADRLGLLMMAEAGIHPDFAIETCRRLRNTVGDQSKIAAFFGSDHPRWATREENMWRYSEQALSAFRSRWDDPARSPGGVPPVVGLIGPGKATKQEAMKSVTISIPYLVRNASEASVEIIFKHKNVLVPAALPEYQYKDGSLRVARPAKISTGNEAAEFTINVPTTALGTKERKLDAWAVISVDGKWIAVSPAFQVSFPKL
jgi:hypothetical protein